MREKARSASLARLSRIEGQVRGIARMVENDRYCIDVLAQLAAVRAALKGVEEVVLKDHVEHCVENAMRSGDPAEQREKMDELLGVLSKLSA
jgi:DNA-binding FrmR family transcriptional regulator